MTTADFWSINASKQSQRKIARLAESIGVDAKALNVLFNTIWDFDSKGSSWVTGVEAPPADLVYAKKAGVMRDSESLTHDELVARVIAARKKLNRKEVAAAFLQSLSTKRMDHRSTLGSLAQVLQLPKHPHAPAEYGDGCANCGAEKRSDVDFNDFLFRRLMWGGNLVQPDMAYILFDLENFTGKDATPSDEDRETLMRLLDAIASLPVKANVNHLQKAIAPHVAGNAGERKLVLENLGSCGILKPRECPGLYDRWVSVSDMPEPEDSERMVWRSPINCWTGADGVNAAAVVFWFGGV